MHLIPPYCGGLSRLYTRPNRASRCGRGCNSLNQNVSGQNQWHSPHLWRRAREPPGRLAAESLVGVDNMNSKGSGSDAKAGAARPLRVGVVGAGVMGSNHARVLAGLPGVTLVGIVDPLPEHRLRATELAGCRAFESLEQLLAEGVDAVTIAAPTHLHHEIALTCIARKIHILVEKPIAPTVQEGRDIVDAAQRAGVTLMVGHVERFNPAVAAIKQAISG